MSITLPTNSLTVASFTLLRKLGSAWSSSTGTSSSSPPAGAKFSARKAWSSELLDSGWVRRLNAAITSSTGLSVGLGGGEGSKSVRVSPRHLLVHAPGRLLVGLHVDECLGVGKGLCKLNGLQDLAVA